MPIRNAASDRSSTQYRPAPRRLRQAAVAILAFGAIALSAASCTPEEVAQIAVSNYFPADQQACALKIVERESGFQADVFSPDHKNVGLFQINIYHKPLIESTFGYEWESLTDANKNAEVAHWLSGLAMSYYKDPWQPWRPDGQPRFDGSCAV